MNIKTDTNGRLHCENGPALSTPNGWQVYAIGGIIVPQKIIESPELITLDDIDKETNHEMKSILISQMGKSKYIALYKEAHPTDKMCDCCGKFYAPLPGHEVFSVCLDCHTKF